MNGGAHFAWFKVVNLFSCGVASAGDRPAATSALATVASSVTGRGYLLSKSLFFSFRLNSSEQPHYPHWPARLSNQRTIHRCLYRARAKAYLGIMVQSTFTA